MRGLVLPIKLIHFPRAEIKNIKIFYLQQVVGYPVFWMSTMYFFLMQVKFLSSAEALSILGFYSLFVLLGEVPTGVVADKHSRRTSVFVGFTLKAIAFGLFLIAADFVQLTLVTLLWGIAESFKSGADSSLVYDTLAGNGHAEEYRQVMHTGKFIRMSFVALFTVIGGVLAAVDLGLTIALSIPFFLAAALITLLWDEPKLSVHAREINDQNYLRHTWLAIREIFSANGLHSGLTALVVVGAVLGGFFSAAKWIINPMLEAQGVSIATISTVVAVLRFVKIGGPAVGARKKDDGIGYMGKLIGGIAVLVGMLVFTANPIITVMVFALLTPIDPIVETDIESRVQGVVSTEKRSTIMSLQSLLQRLVTAVALPLFGFLSDTYSVSIAAAGLLALIVATGVFWGVSGRGNAGKVYSQTFPNFS